MKPVCILAQLEAQLSQLIIFSILLLSYPSTRHNWLAIVLLNQLIYIQMRSQQCGLKHFNSNSIWPLSGTKFPVQYLKTSQSALMLIHPTIITYVDDGALESLAIYISFTPLLSWLHLVCIASHLCLIFVSFSPWLHAMVTWHTLWSLHTRCLLRSISPSFAISSSRPRSSLAQE